MEEERTSLIVCSVRPPFLTGSVQFTRQTEMVMTVKDPTSNFAILAKKGSEILKSWMHEKEKRRVVDKDRFWDLAGSKMGKVMGVREVKEFVEGGDMQTDEEAKYVILCDFIVYY